MLLVTIFSIILVISNCAKVNRILIITLKSRVDKMKLAEVHMKALGNSDYTFIYGLNGTDFLTNRPNNQELEQLTGIDNLSVNFSTLSVGNGPTFGLFYSHVMVFKYIVKNNIEGPVLIMEDDAIADGNALKIIEECLEELPKDWGIFYPGHCDSAWMCEKHVGKTKSICLARHHVTCAHAYMINGQKAAEELIETARKEKYALADLFAQRSPLKRYVLFPSVFTQSKKYFSIRSDLGSGGGLFPKLANETAALVTKKFFEVHIAKGQS